MPKPITLEMLHAMDLDQRKTLHRNASGLDTPAARDVLALLAQDDLMGPPKAAPAARKSPARKTSTARRPAASAKPKAAASAKPKAAVYGRQS